MREHGGEPVVKTVCVWYIATVISNSVGGCRKKDSGGVCVTSSDKTVAQIPVVGCKGSMGSNRSY
jgi:hypothetical protein